MGSSNFLSELKRRQIYRGGVMYVVAGWVIVQVATTVFPYFDIPSWAIRLVVVAILLGFPIALVALWMFESTLPDDPQARLHDRRQARDSTDTMTRLMEAERIERQKENQELIAVLGQLKGQPAPSAETVSIARESVRTRQADTPEPAPGSPLSKRKRKRTSLVLLSMLGLAIVLSGVWALVTPQGASQTAATSEQLAEKYVAPGFKQAEEVGIFLLTPILNKLGISLAPDRVFTILLVIAGFFVLRYFYRGIARSRMRRARQH